MQGTNILLLILGAIFIAGYINVANFMDGINGISGAHGLVAGLAYALTGWMVNLPWLLGWRGGCRCFCGVPAVECAPG